MAESRQLATFVIQRPVLGLEILSMNYSDWLKNKMVYFFPDGLSNKSSDFPHSGISLCCKWQGHFVIASGHKEKWILSNANFTEVDLGFFGPEWNGCSATLCRI
jgi:hypothetical protein